MKNSLSLIIAMLLFVLATSAQAPQYIPWQAVVRDTSWNPLPNQFVSFRFTVHTGSSTGTVVYKETDTATTNRLGMVNVQIGSGTVITGTFSSINWSSGSEFLQVELDPAGGSSFITMGAPQMMSVPYALYSGSSYWATSGSNLSVIDTTKQLAIGTSAASTTLTVLGNISASQSYSDNNGGGQLLIDSAALFFIEQADNSSIVSALCVGDGSNLLGPGAPHLAALVGHDGGANILYGLLSMPDSAFLLTQSKSMGIEGLVGTYDYSSFLDARYNTNNSLNSLTLDTVGLHYEFMDTDRYSFPNTDGLAGQVLTTDGSGHLGWGNGGQGKAMFTPTTGATITAVWGNNIINPVTSLAALTITLPSSPTDNETVYFTFTKTITTLSFTGGSISGALSTVSSVSTGSLKYWLTYDAGSSTWY